MINENYLKLPGAYLFAEIARRVQAYKEEHADVRVTSLGIGDVTQPLSPAVIDALHRATDEMASATTFHGYGPERGHAFLREAIVEHDFRSRGIDIGLDEVFVSDGAKSDTAAFQELLAADVRIAVTDPVYPVYVDSNVMGGRGGELGRDGRWSDIIYLPCTAATGFVPEPPATALAGVESPRECGRGLAIYLCYPNNPTGTALTREELRQWVDYALANDALILYDAAYEAYIQTPGVPHSIYELEGARRCAVEFHSYSKTAGFTGLRCGYTVVPKELRPSLKVSASGQAAPSLNALWNRRQSTKFNGASYLSQRAAEAIYTAEGKAQIRATISHYMETARLMRESLTAMGFTVYGGVDAPYLWLQTPGGMGSWQFFDEMLSRAHVVCTPGVGFGPSGEGYVRLTAFGDRRATEEALGRISDNRQRWAL